MTDQQHAGFTPAPLTRAEARMLAVMVRRWHRAEAYASECVAKAEALRHIVTGLRALKELDRG